MNIKLNPVVGVCLKQLHFMFASVRSTAASVTLSAVLFIICCCFELVLVGVFSPSLDKQTANQNKTQKTADNITFKAYEK